METNALNTILLIILIVWLLIWKGLGLWRAGRNNQPRWFVVMLILNTVGILPIVYLKFFQKKKEIPGKKMPDTGSVRPTDRTSNTEN
jgi:magnesium-transporting ATPase (P-type)